MKEVLVSPSILGVNKNDLIEVTSSLLLSGASLIHFDVMDGSFVTNKSFLEDEIDILSNFVKEDILDVHLMCLDLDKMIEKFSKKHVKYISIHYEAKGEDELISYSYLIKEKGIVPGIVINPSTEVEKVYPLLKYYGLVLVMSVVPGKGGQSFMPCSLEKIEKLVNFRKENNLDFVIEVDGGINEKTSLLVKEKGVDILVAGSYILKSDNFKERIEKLR